MSTPANHFLDQGELDLLHNQDIWQQKHRILLKTESWLINLRDQLLSIRSSLEFLPSAYRKASPRITRGDNYRMLPYRVLDFPRYFSGGDMFLFRTVILWGNPIGMHLILSGEPKVLLRKAIYQGLSEGKTNYLLCVHTDPWQWAYSEKEWVDPQKLSPAGLDQEIEKREFLKISQFLPLEQYEALPRVGKQILEEGLSLCQGTNGVDISKG